MNKNIVDTASRRHDYGVCVCVAIDGVRGERMCMR